ncbi:methyltransferase [Amycolatopsis japonica]|uniref:methyltransferase n=1 Tax=Amycolatopsis japonica TaxID=208439 RepID=UPI00332BD4EB
MSAPTLDLFRAADILTPWAVRVAATLRIADHLAAGRTRLPDLAEAAGADTDALGRLLRHLARQGVFAEPSEGVFALTESAEPLRTDHPGSWRARLDLTGIGGRIDGAFAGLLHSVRTGEPGYSSVFGRSFWADAADPSIIPSFDAIMSGHDYWFHEVAEGYDWAGVSTVVDVGGGAGGLLTEILSRFPRLSGTVFDLPATVVEAKKVLEEAGLTGRATTYGGDFFEPLPPGADVYLLSNVLHDWSDPDARRILRRCAEAAGRDGRVLIADRVVDDRADQSVTAMDLRVLVLMGGRERTEAAWRALAGSADLTVGKVVRRDRGVTLLDCALDDRARIDDVG